MKVSAIIPAFNAANTITRAVDSVLAQSHPFDEVLIIDDGSTDNTAEIVRNYGDEIRYFYQNNTGLSGAMNFGIKQARGEWIAVLDADDEWLPGFVKSHVKLISKSPDVKWTYCRHEEVTQNGRRCVQIPQAVEEEIEREGFLSYFRVALAGFGFGKCGFMIKRSVFDELGNFDPAMPNGMDRDMWRRIALRYPRIAVCGEVRWRWYRDNPVSLSRRGAGSRDLQLKSLCRNMHRAIELGSEVVNEYRPFARMLAMDYLLIEAGTECFISSDTIEDAKSLFPLTVRERVMLRILRLLPKPIALKVVGRLSL
ncbi:MAG TPA: glycosyltransferase [Sedimentisphaerales bacterium]|nr:glycosyltransferase [Sedimentisphaerales bacterium]